MSAAAVERDGVQRLACGERERLLDRLMPRLAEPRLAAEAAARGRPLVHRPAAFGGLVTLYVVDGEEAVVYLRSASLGALGTDTATVHRRAIANLARRPVDALVRQVVESRRMSMVSVGDSHDAARVLLVPGSLREGEELLALVPDRDTLGLLPVPTGDGWALVRRLARTTRSPHRLLAAPLRVSRTGFALV